MRKWLLRFGLLMLVASMAFLTGCSSAYMMKTSVIDPGDDYAVVNFMRPSSFGGGIKFGLWDKDQLVGILTPKQYIQYKALPGEHIFMAKAENWSVIKATVEPGKEYYVLVAPQMGVFRTRVRFEVIQPDDERLATWMKKVEPSMVVPEKRDEYVDPRLDDVRKAVKNVEEGRASFMTMKPSDGK